MQIQPKHTFQKHSKSTNTLHILMVNSKILSEIKNHSDQTGFFYLQELDSLKGNYYSKGLI